MAVGWIDFAIDLQFDHRVLRKLSVGHRAWHGDVIHAVAAALIAHRLGPSLALTPDLVGGLLFQKDSRTAAAPATCVGSR